MFISELCKKQTFINNRNGRSYKLIPLVKELSSNNVLLDIVAICNEQLIYNVLFNSTLKGAQYSNEKAESFINWAHQGWESKGYFVFLIMDELEERVCGSIDIKSNDLKSGEVGYWASQKHSGIASPALKTIIDMAKGAGYKALHAYVVPSNEKSAYVLVNNGFSKNADSVLHNNKSRYFFSKQLGN